MSIETFCVEAGIPCTKRQRRKFANGQGLALHAKRLRLVELRAALRVAQEKVNGQSGKLLTVDDSDIEHVEWVLAELQRRLGLRSFDYETAKRKLPKYSPHITRK